MAVQNFLLGEGDADAFGHGESAIGIGVRQDEREFFAAIAGRDVDLAPCFGFDDAGDERERAVAGRMAIVIVVGLEVIDIDQQKRKRRALATVAGPFPFESEIETAAVGEAGQAVRQREMFELACCFLQCQFGIPAPIEFAGETQQQDGRQRQQQDHRQHDDHGTPFPIGENFRLRLGNGENDWKFFQPRISVETIFGGRFGFENATCFAIDDLQQIFHGQPHRRIGGAWRTDQQRPIGSHQGGVAASAQIEPIEKGLEIGDAQSTGDDATKAAVRAGEAA